MLGKVSIFSVTQFFVDREIREISVIDIILKSTTVEDKVIRFWYQQNERL